MRLYEFDNELILQCTLNVKRKKKVCNFIYLNFKISLSYNLNFMLKCNEKNVCLYSIAVAQCKVSFLIPIVLT